MFHFLLTMIAVIFWAFRIVVTVGYNMGANIGVIPLNFIAEIILLFVTLFCLILIVKKSLVGAIIYLISYGAYFGVDLYNKLNSIIELNNGINDYTSMGVSFLAIIIALAVFANIGLTGKGKTTNQKTDWFFKNKNLDRKLDERADKNQYKF